MFWITEKRFIDIHGFQKTSKQRPPRSNNNKRFVWQSKLIETFFFFRIKIDKNQKNFNVRMAAEVPMEYMVVRDPDSQEIASGGTAATRTTSTMLFVSDITDDNKLLEEIVVKFGVESVSNPTQRALRWDEITKTFNSLSLTLSGKIMTKDQVSSPNSLTNCRMYMLVRSLLH